MSCTTVLVGRKASNDGSTMIARTDDGDFDVNKTIVVLPKDQPKKYKSKMSKFEITLPDDPMKYTASPSVDPQYGIWAATGINEANVGMTATETITSNPRVLAADPLIELEKKGKRLDKRAKGGIGEEDIVVLVLPYIRTAREGVKRLASLLEQYGTYESNGIAFNDENEIWWMETIGGHHWIAKKVPDDVVVVNPNQFGTDSFDLKDALGKQKEHMCSADMKEFISENDLDLNQGKNSNPRDIFGSHSDMDHIYNTPRAWFMGRFLAPKSHSWDGENAEFRPDSDYLPWSLVPDRKVAAEDVQYMLSGHFQGTPYDPYTNRDTGMRGMYRSIGINRTGVTTICQIRSGVPDEIKAIEWVCYGPTPFSCWVPVYTNVDALPDFLSRITLDVSTNNLYWTCRLIAAMADKSFSTTMQDIERMQDAVNIKGRHIIREYDRRMTESGDFTLTAEADKKISQMVKEETGETLSKVLKTSSVEMKNGFNMKDH